jgi:hypothetical protein
MQAGDKIGETGSVRVGQGYLLRKLGLPDPDVSQNYTFLENPIMD